MASLYLLQFHQSFFRLRSSHDNPTMHLLQFQMAGRGLTVDEKEVGVKEREVEA